MPAPVHDDETAKGWTHSRCQGTDQHGGSHHGPDAVERCLFQDDVEHEGERNARARILKDPSQEQDGKIRHCCARQRSCEENQIAADKETFQWKAVFQVARCRDDDGQDEQAARGDPLDKGCIPMENCFISVGKMTFMEVSMTTPMKKRMPVARMER